MPAREKEFKDTVWQMRKGAHQVHHHIADFIIHHDDREAPPKLAALLRKYRQMMQEANGLKATAASARSR